MRRLGWIAPLLLVIFLGAGCTFLANQKAKIDACKSDLGPDGVAGTGDECYAQAKVAQAKFEKVGEVVGDIVGSAPFIPPTGAKYAGKIGSKLFGVGALIVVMLHGGSAILRERKVVSGSGASTNG